MSSNGHNDRDVNWTAGAAPVTVAVKFPAGTAFEHGRNRATVPEAVA